MVRHNTDDRENFWLHHIKEKTWWNEAKTDDETVQIEKEKSNREIWSIYRANKYKGRGFW